MTELQVLQATRAMWQWLADNPTKDKDDYFVFIQMPPRDIPNYRCYCCQYMQDVMGDEWSMRCAANYNTHFNEWINHCPLKHIWPSGCEDRESPYFRWKVSLDPEVVDPQLATKFALEIVAGCDEAIRQTLLDEKTNQQTNQN